MGFAACPHGATPTSSDTHPLSLTRPGGRAGEEEKYTKGKGIGHGEENHLPRQVSPALTVVP